MHIETLDTDGFVSVVYPRPLYESVQHAMVSWKDFCALSFDEKLKFSNGDRIRDFGYMLRKDSGPRADHKELFHVSRTQVYELKVRAQKMTDPRAAAFIDAIDTLLQESVPLIELYAEKVEHVYEMTGFRQAVLDALDNWTFRYLHYFGGKTLAHPHTDRGGFTLHLHESHPGGEYLNFDGIWRPWPVSDTQTIIFPGMGLQHYSQGKLKALWHRVQPCAESASDGRYSMVAFIDFKQQYRYNDAAKRLQDFEPGFNYRISPEQFHELFVPRI